MSRSTVFFWLVGLIAAFIVVNALLALFERFSPLKARRFFMKRIGNPMFRLSCGILPGYGVVEVVGRKTGQLHRVNVGGRLKGNTFWFLARSDAQYLRNLQANPQVRVQVHGRWAEGVARTCPEIDPQKQLLRLNPANGFFLWLVGAELVTVQVSMYCGRAC